MDIPDLINSFLESNNIQEKNIKFVELIEKLQFLDSNESDLLPKTPKFWHGIIEFCAQNITKRETFISTIQFLERHFLCFSVSKVYDMVLKLFLNTFYISVSDSALFSQCTGFFIQCFNDQKIAFELANSTSFELAFRYSFFEVSTPYASHFLSCIILENANDKFFVQLCQGKMFQKLYEMLRYGLSNQQGCIDEILTFLISIIIKSLSLYPKCIESVMKEQNLQVLYDSIDVLNDKQKEDQFILFLRTTPYFPERFNILLKKYYGPGSFFKALVHVIQNDKQLIPIINQNISISKIPPDTISTDELLNFTYLISVDNPSLITLLIPNLLNTLKPSLCSSEVYLRVFALIEKQLSKRFISLGQMLEMGFLTVYISNVPPEFLIEFFLKSQSFAQLSLDVFSLSNEPDLQNEIFQAVVSLIPTHAQSDQFKNICSAFLNVIPSRKNIQSLLTLIQDTHHHDLISILQICCMKSADASKFFVDLGGIKWAFSQFSEDSISDNQFSMLLGSVSSHYTYHYIEEYILQLNRSHKIFSLSSSYVENIVYGLTQTTRFRQIKVPSLFYMLKSYNESDPYNLFIIGKCCMNDIQNVASFPLLPLVSNQFIQSKYIDTILQTSNPLDYYCDPHFDHFPLFQFFPGKGEISIDTEFSSCSLWFKFEEPFSYEMQIFRSESLTVLCRDTLCTVIFESQRMQIDFEPCIWNHLVIRTDNTLISSALIITINELVINMNPKKKLNIFKKALIGSNTQTLLFLGSAIRFSRIYTNDVTVLRGKGPGNLEPLSELNETLVVTPYSQENTFIPKNCFAVEYSGFPYHFYSVFNQMRILNMLKCCDKSSRFESIFSTICNILVITKNSIDGFSKRLINCIKKSKISITYELLIKMINSLTPLISISKHEELFFSILYDTDLWDKVNSAIIIRALFDAFPRINWRTIDNAELYLATLAAKYPDNNDYIYNLFKNAKRIPKTIKYLVVLMKSGYILSHPTWDIAISRDHSMIQESILSSISDIISKQPNDFSQPMVSFDDLRLLFLASKPLLASKVFHLMAIINNNYPGYIQTDSLFFLSFAKLCSYSIVWKDTMNLLRGNRGELRSLSYIPFILHLIWSAALGCVHSRRINKCNKEIEKIENHINESVAFLMRFSDNLLDSTTNISCICSYFPLILYYPVLFKENDTIEQNEQLPLVPIVASNLPDVSDPLWNEIEIQNLSIGDPPKTISSMKFLRSIVSTIFSELGLCDACLIHDSEDVLLFISSSPLFIMLSDVILRSTNDLFFPLSKSLLFGSPFRDNTISKNCSPCLLGILLSRLTVPLQNDIPYDNLFSVVLYLSSQNLLTEHSVEVTADIFRIFNSMIWTFGEGYMLKNSLKLFSVVLQLYAISDCHNQDLIMSSVFVPNEKIFIQLIKYHNLIKEWIHIISKTLPQRLDFFLKNLSDIESEKPKTDQLYPVEWDEFIQGFHKLFEGSSSMIKDSNGYIVEFSQLSRDLLKTLYFANSKHFIQAQLFKMAQTQSLDVLNVIVSSVQMSNIISEIQDSMKHSISEDRVLSSRTHPFKAPKVVIPICNSFKDIVLHKDSDPKKNLDIYNKIQRESPISIISCDLIRFSESIPCTLFMYESRISILAYSFYNDGQVSIPKALNEDFVMSLFAGNWGQISSFRSTFIIHIRSCDILHMLKNSSQQVNIWSVYSGHFIIRSIESSISTIESHFSKYFKCVSDSIIPGSLQDRTKTPAKTISSWTKGMVSTFDMIIAINYLTGRSYIDSDNLPLLPKFPDQQDIDETVTQNSSSFLLLPIPDVFPGFNEYMDQLSLESNKPFLLKWMKSVFNTPDPDTSFSDSSAPPTIELLVEQNKCKINVLESSKSKRIFISQPEFAFITSVSLSPSNCFFSVDFSFCATRTYRILYNKGCPASIDLISQYSSPTQPFTVMSDWICATHTNSSLTFWDAITGIPTKRIIPEYPIEKLSYSHITDTFTTNSDNYTVNGDCF